MQEKTNLFYTAKDVAEILHKSIATAYRVIKELNEEMKEKGYRIQNGVVSKRYFEERYYF